jgi:hypothetical protein
LLDGLWLESGLNPGTFTPEQGVQICEAWVDGLQAGGRQRFFNKRRADEQLLIGCSAMATLWR